MRSPRRVLIERLRRELAAQTEVVDIAARLKVWRRGADGVARPAETLPRIWGGRFNRLAQSYTGASPERVATFRCHPGQLELLLADGPEVRTLALGAPGGGKSFAAEIKAILCMLDWPNEVGGIVAPTEKRRGILFQDMLDHLQPLGWIEHVSLGSKLEPPTIRLINGAAAQFVSTHQQSKATGTPLQGYSWRWAVEDEHQNMSTKACQEVNFRGRRVGGDYRIFSTATDQYIPEFQLRLEEWYRNNPVSGVAKLLSFPGESNVFAAEDNWEMQRAFLSHEDYERLIEGKHHAQQGTIYRAFAHEHNVRALPDVRHDVTAELTQAKYGHPYTVVIGTDLGSTVNASVVLKAFRDIDGGVYWYVIDEIVTEECTAQRHALAILGKIDRAARLGPASPTPGYRSLDAVVVLDPHCDRKEHDRSDKKLIEAEGLKCEWAGAPPIAQKHRFAMVNSLWCDATGKRRLFVARDGAGKAVAPRLVNSAKLYRYEDVGKKGPGDLSHYTDDLGYGLYPFERIRGNPEAVAEQRRREDPFASRIADKTKERKR